MTLRHLLSQSIPHRLVQLSITSIVEHWPHLIPAKNDGVPVCVDACTACVDNVPVHQMENGTKSKDKNGERDTERGRSSQTTAAMSQVTGQKKKIKTPYIIGYENIKKGEHAPHETVTSSISSEKKKNLKGSG